MSISGAVEATLEDSEAVVRSGVTRLVYEKPIEAAALAGALGVVLGGVIFSKLGRVVFLAAAGYVANELWRRDGQLNLSELLSSIGQTTPKPQP